jgi:cephalosporin hydroxylase
LKLILDSGLGTLIHERDGQSKQLNLYSPEAFQLLSEQWVRVGWQQRYSYQFTWCGIPVIQLPEDLVRIQEVIYQVRPDVLIETGVAHGGSLIFYASLFKAMGQGRVVGIDVEIRPHNRQAIESHELFPLITLVEASSTAPECVATVKALVRPGEKVMVVLDSNHTKEHVLAELNAYAELLTVGSYIVATDGIMKDLADLPEGEPDWRWNNPCAAVDEFLRRHQQFELAEPEFRFNEGAIRQRVTYWPGAWLRRKTEA